MTGFAALKGLAKGENTATRWAWEVRSVNARGLDLRLRLPEGMASLEAALRKELAANLTRGNVTLSLRLQSDAGSNATSLDENQLDRVLAAMKIVEDRAENAGLHLTASTAADIVALRGIMDNGTGREDDLSALETALKAQVSQLVADFVAARAAEGAALHGILDDQLTKIAALMAEASAALEGRASHVAKTLRSNLAQILENTEGVDETRIAQELALLAVKADVTEELDRLIAHVAAARALLATKGAVGRKFDFLMQEFNREANTLCSKSGSTELTRIGLDLKTLIDQMREQVQNVE